MRILGATENPIQSWVVPQARNLLPGRRHRHGSGSAAQNVRQGAGSGGRVAFGEVDHCAAKITMIR